MNFSFGSDPEFMLCKHGKYYSAIGIMKGTKKARVVVEGHEFYYDNVMAECALKPGKTKTEVISNIKHCFGIMSSMVSPYKLVPQAFLIYTKDQLVHPDSREVGCDEEYCAYKRDRVDISSTSEIIKSTAQRTAGGHIHLGAMNRTLQDGYYQQFVIKMLDLFLGVPLLYIDKDETAGLRRRIYGNAGRHRRPVHGIEYRTPGNYWLSSPKLVAVVYDICDFVLDFVEKDRQFDLWNKSHECTAYSAEDLCNCINESNLVVGERYLGMAKDYMPSKLYDSVCEAMSYKHFDMYKEWGLWNSGS